MKALNKVAVQTENQVTKSMDILSRNIDTFYRIAGNTDHETFRKECIAFRSGMVGVEIAKNGMYTIPKNYNDMIDGLIDGDHRSDRQAYKSSLVACYFLGKHGTDSKAYLTKASKGKTALEALSPDEWAIIKRDVKAEQRKAKALKAVPVVTVTTDTSAPTAPTAPSAPSAPSAPTTLSVTTAPRVDVEGRYNYLSLQVTADTLTAMQDVKKKLETKYSQAELACLAKLLMGELFEGF